MIILKYMIIMKNMIILNRMIILNYVIIMNYVIILNYMIILKYMVILKYDHSKDHITVFRFPSSCSRECEGQNRRRPGKDSSRRL